MAGEPQAGDVFAGLLLEEEIGRGGMGVVFRARDVALDRRRAVKVIAGEYSSDPAFAARFRREARIASSVEHPNVVPVHRAGEEDGRLYLVMRLVGGSDLARLLEQGPLEPDRAISLLRQVAAGLDAAHGAGLVHRDVKPANVLVEAGPDGDHAYLTDFGISKLAAREGEDATAATGLTGGGQVIGTADYVAPEQVEGDTADARSDVYSLACVAFTALTGTPPFARDTELATLVAHTKASRPLASALVPRLPPAVDAVLRDGMAIEPGQRPESAGAFVEMLATAMSNGRARRPGRPIDRTSARSGARRVAWAAGVVLALAAALVAFFLLRGNGPEESTPPGAASSPAKPKLTTASVGAGPVAVAVGELRLWVASRDGNQIDRLRMGSLEPFGDPVPLPAPRSVAVGFGSIWVVDGDVLYRLDPGEGAAPQRIAVGQGPGDVAVDASYVWVSDEDSDTVTRVDPAGNEATATVRVCDAPRSIATGAGAVWVVCSGDATLMKIDPGAAKVEGRPVPVGLRPTAVAYGAGRVWVTDNASAKLFGVEPGAGGEGSGDIAVSARTSASPRGVAFGLGAVWVAGGAADAVDRFDPATGERIGRPIPVGGNPADIAVGAGAAFTADFDDATVTRIEP